MKIPRDLSGLLSPEGGDLSQPRPSAWVSSFYIFCPDVFCRRCGQLAVFLVKSVFKDLS